MLKAKNDQCTMHRLPPSKKKKEKTKNFRLSLIKGIYKTAPNKILKKERVWAQVLLKDKLESMVASPRVVA